jgi:hypothetical protein
MIRSLSGLLEQRTGETEKNKGNLKKLRFTLHNGILTATKISEKDAPETIFAVFHVTSKEKESDESFSRLGTKIVLAR